MPGHARGGDEGARTSSKTLEASSIATTSSHIMVQTQKGRLADCLKKRAELRFLPNKKPLGTVFAERLVTHGKEIKCSLLSQSHVSEFGVSKEKEKGTLNSECFTAALIGDTT